MKIVFFTENMSKGGAQRVISVLSNYFCENGNDIRIVLTDRRDDIAYALNNKIRVVFADEWIINNSTLRKMIRKNLFRIKSRIWISKSDIFEEKLFFQYAADDFVEYLRKEPADRVIGFLVKPNIILGLGANRIRSRIIVAERNYPDRPTFEDHFKQLRNKCYSKADYCVFQTKEQAEMFPDSVRKKAVVIMNPIKDDLPEPHHGVRKKIIVNYCGYKEHKNISLLIDAFSIVHKNHPEYSLEVYGYGEQKDILQRIIDEIGLTESVKLLPFEKNIHEKVKDYAMFVMSSDYEGMPNALIEAMGIGLPVVSTDCLGGGAKAVIENGVNGLLLPIRDADALSNAMNSIIEYPDKTEEMRKNALSIKQNLSVERIAQQWVTEVLE